MYHLSMNSIRRIGLVVALAAGFVAMAGERPSEKQPPARTASGLQKDGDALPCGVPPYCNEGRRCTTPRNQPGRCVAQAGRCVCEPLVVSK
jgi:hypothetical protein